jgi:nucleotide-binding universal stress UspA family protein
MSPPSAGTFQPANRIVIPVEGTDREFEAQQWAAKLAASLGIPVHALHVQTGPEDERNGDADHFSFIEQLAEKWDIELRTRVAGRDDVAQEILDELGPRDLAVIGTRKMANSGQYQLSSVAAELVRRAPCPVQIVRLE